MCVVAQYFVYNSMKCILDWRSLLTDLILNRSQNVQLKTTLDHLYCFTDHNMASVRLQIVYKDHLLIKNISIFSCWYPYSC